RLMRQPCLVRLCPPGAHGWAEPVHPRPAAARLHATAPAEPPSTPSKEEASLVLGFDDNTAWHAPCRRRASTARRPGRGRRPARPGYDGRRARTGAPAALAPAPAGRTGPRAVPSK